MTWEGVGGQKEHRIYGLREEKGQVVPDRGKPVMMKMTSYSTLPNTQLGVLVFLVSLRGLLPEWPSRDATRNWKY